MAATLTVIPRFDPMANDDNDVDILSQDPDAMDFELPPPQSQPSKPESIPSIAIPNKPSVSKPTGNAAKAAEAKAAAKNTTPAKVAKTSASSTPSTASKATPAPAPAAAAAAAAAVAPVSKPEENKVNGVASIDSETLMEDLVTYYQVKGWDIPTARTSYMNVFRDAVDVPDILHRLQEDRGKLDSLMAELMSQPSYQTRAKRVIDDASDPLLRMFSRKRKSSDH